MATPESEAGDGPGLDAAQQGEGERERFREDRQNRFLRAVPVPQVVADPFSRPLWAPPALPGAVHDGPTRATRVPEALFAFPTASGGRCFPPAGSPSTGLTQRSEPSLSTPSPPSSPGGSSASSAARPPASRASFRLSFACIWPVQNEEGKSSLSLSTAALLHRAGVDRVRGALRPSQGRARLLRTPLRHPLPARTRLHPLPDAPRQPEDGRPASTKLEADLLQRRAQAEAEGWLDEIEGLGKPRNPPSPQEVSD
jgi:hypothetical protein